MNAPPDLHTNQEASPQWRLFLAVPLPENVRAELADLSERLQKGVKFSRCRPSWARCDTIHLTLAFLGNRPAELVGPIAEAAREVAASYAPLRIEIKRLGVFPDWHHPHVLWAGVRERTHQLEPLQQALTISLARLGYEPDEKPFHPHLTLARIKSLTGVSALRSIVDSHQNYEMTPFDADELVLYRSQLDPAGAIHMPIDRLPFAAPHPPTTEK